MANDPLDLESVRRRWALAAAAGAAARTDPPRAPPSPPPEGARPPLDPFVRARGDLAELRARLAEGLRHEASTLEPFLLRIERAVAQIELAAGAPKALRAELDDALFDLEDLLEALALAAK